MEPSWSMRLISGQAHESANETDDGIVVGEDSRDVDGVTFVRRLISLFNRSSGLVECSLFQWSFGKAI
jgi:hypothetical protein